MDPLPPPVRAPPLAIFDAIEALEALGYFDAEIRSVIDTAPKDSSADAIIKYALCKL